MIALIIVFAVVGYMAGTASRGLHGMHVFRHGSDQDDFFSHLLGQEHDDDRSLNQSIPAGAPDRHPGAAWRRDRDSLRG